MKKSVLLMAGAFAGTALMMAGCQPKEEPKMEPPTAPQIEQKAPEAAAATEKAQPPTTTQVEQKAAEEAAATEKAVAEHPATTTPKDHPAH